MKKQLTVSDIKGNVHTLELEDTDVIRFDSKYPHWGWWVLWLLLFWPACFLLFFARKRVYYVQYEGKEVIVDEYTGQRIIKYIDKLEEQ